MKIQKLQLVIFSVLMVEMVSAQNPRLSQLINSNMLLNPAMTVRFDGQARVGGLYSWQKSDYAEMPHVYAFSEIKLGRYRSSGDEAHLYQNEKQKTGKPGPEAKDEITKPRQSNPKGYWGLGLHYYRFGDSKSPLQAQFISGSIARHFYSVRNRYFGVGGQVTYAMGDLDEKRGTAYDKEISGGTFRYPKGVPGSRVGEKNYVDFNLGAYYGRNTEAVAFEFGLAMYHMFYPNISIVDNDSESKLRHRVSAYSMLRLRVNDKWGFVQKNLYWQEGLYYRSKSFKDSLNITDFWCGTEFYRTEPKSFFNLNAGFYTRSFRTLMPVLNLNLGRIATIRATYEHPINTKKYNAYNAKRAEVSMVFTYGRKTTLGTRFYKKVNFW